MESKIVITLKAEDHEMVEEIFEVIKKLWGQPIELHDALDVEKLQFVLHFYDSRESVEPMAFVIEFMSSSNLAIRLTEGDYRNTDWDPAYPAYFLEIV